MRIMKRLIGAIANLGNLIITIILLMQIYVKRGIKKTPRNITQTNH